MVQGCPAAAAAMMTAVLQQYAGRRVHIARRSAAAAAFAAAHTNPHAQIEFPLDTQRATEMSSAACMCPCAGQLMNARGYVLESWCVVH
jgi:hypothetical protein